MQKWKQKAIVQKAISYLPFGHKVNYLFQKYVTKGVYLTDTYFYDRLEHAKVHLDGYRKFSGNLVPASTLEIGTGWYPTVPICFFLSGADKIYSVDISFLTSKERIQSTLLKFEESKQAGQLEKYIPVIPERFAVINLLLKNYTNLTLDEILQQLHITYLIEDARNLTLPDNSIDLVHSNNTFEHIYPEILAPILKEFKRVVKKDGGVLSHAIDMSDHFAHFDTSINIYHFLRFTDNEWKWIDNSIQPQSRLQFYDYKKMYAELGIPISEETCRAGNITALQNVPLAAKYATYPLQETAVSHCHFISNMRSATNS